MSSLEQPLGLEKLPSLRTIERLDSFRSTSCSPRGVDGGMRECWIEGRSSGSSNSCSEDFEEYRRESFTWSRTRNEIFCRSSCLDHSNGIYGIKCDSPYFSYHQYNSFDKNGKGIKTIVHKVWKGIPDYVKIVEVGPRDGLQNEKIVVPIVPTATAATFLKFCMKMKTMTKLYLHQTVILWQLCTMRNKQAGRD
ncbi:hypothetical protein POM88_035013 [Heracleum sosnowskyi]|uniref:Uncharacterized protein n=1 Tax=Heracleum sosnowskyi TaxID=360622 RepID=A0AAD8HLM8_9APIA|nr:hypothetical protein POM88_035013 [Heracleum sosnowskyi]